MKRHLNTLYVTTEGSYVAKEREAVIVRREGTTVLRVPIHMLDSIVCFGAVKVSPYLMALAAERGVSISFMTPRGRFLARVHGFTSGNVLLRKDQFRASEDTESALDISRVIVKAKIHNCRVQVLRSGRDHGDGSGALDLAAGHLRRCLERAGRASDMDQLRGVEGEAAKHYFRVFSEMVRAPFEEFRMVGRTKRPPKDPINALLSFVYVLLAADCRGACESVGLDPQVGFLHADRPGRPGLALDLMEELRPVIAERVVLSLVNRQQVSSKEFVSEVGGAVRMTDSARKTVLEQYQTRKEEELKHPFLGEKVTLGLVPLLQARLLARTLRGELDTYPPFVWR